MTKYIPTELKLWTRPDHYFGASWPDHYVFLGRHRDSHMIDESNWDAALSELGGESATVQIVRESHWAVGWVEWIAIHKDDSVSLRKADDIAARLKQYPILDESDLSEREMEAAHEFWKGWTKEPDLRHRLHIIADWNRQHSGEAWKEYRVPFLAARHDLGELSVRYPNFEEYIARIACE